MFSCFVFCFCSFIFAWIAEDYYYFLFVYTIVLGENGDQYVMPTWTERVVHSTKEEVHHLTVPR